MEILSERNARRAMARGFKGTCPRCGDGPLFDGYLKVADRCPQCGLDLTPQRADDGPAYLTVVIVGHLLVPLLVPVYLAWDPDPLLIAGVFGLASVVLSLGLLPRLKGAMIGLQWAKRLHGF
ncbi:MAG: DUF983 domain-containing protein [Pseudomonadota bacterium]